MFQTPSNAEKGRAKAAASDWLEGQRRRSRATYPPAMVAEARKMRGRGFTYKEIAEALRDHFGLAPHWITVRDCTGYYYRMRA